MPKIYLIIDYSAGANWLYSTLAHNRAILDANGFDFAPFDSDDPERVPWNIYFWQTGEDWIDKRIINSRLEKVKTSLQEDRNVLILGRIADIEVQRKFFDFIHKNVAGNDYKVFAIMCFGKPALSLESWWDATATIHFDDAIKHNMDYATHLSSLAYSALDAIGSQNLHLLPFMQDYMDEGAVADNCQKVFEFLGIDEKPQIPGPLPFYGFTSTATGKRLFEARKVRHNEWPKLDNFRYISILHDLEKDWRPEPVTTLAYRQEFLQKSKNDQKKLEKLLKLLPGALDAPKWYGEVEGLSPEAPLEDEKVRAFARALPQNEREVLLKRFDNDRRFLTEDQKFFANILAEMAGADFEHLEIGDAAPSLTVLTMTRNHEKYIGECIESVLAQKTDFPVRHLVLDHYSTDGTPDIVNKYARDYSSIRPVLLRDYHSTYNNIQELLGRCDSEYAALCDGDDYFISPHKLQKQVDFLKSHPKCSLVFHPVKIVFEDSNQNPGYFPGPDMLPRGLKEEYYLADLFKGNFIQTNTVVYRWRFAEGLPEWFRSDLCPGDWYWHLLHAEKGKIGFIPNVMSVYRRHANALYVNSFRNTKEHRRTLGMPELETYKVINDHFAGRYFRNLASLAYGVFFNFLELSLEEDDNSLLETAYLKYPDFGAFFMEQIKKTKASEKNKDVSET